MSETEGEEEKEKRRGGRTPIALQRHATNLNVTVPGVPLLESLSSFHPQNSNRKDLQPHYGMNCVPTNVHMLNSKPPVTQNVNGLGDRVF